MAEKEKNRPTLSEPKTEAAREARRSFDRRVEEQLKKEEQIAFNILVWGMSPDQNTPIARKREDIGHQLIEDGHNAMFSEDLADFGREPSRSETGKEFAQAKSADFIIVLIRGVGRGMRFLRSPGRRFKGLRHGPGILQRGLCRPRCPAGVGRRLRQRPLVSGGGHR